MSNVLKELLKREQVKLSRNTFELAGFYCPMGRIPDLIDFVMMKKRLELLQNKTTTVKELWPQASESFASKLDSRVTYTLEQLAACTELAKTCKEGGLTDQEMYESGLKNSRMYQVQANDHGGTAA